MPTGDLRAGFAINATRLCVAVTLPKREQRRIKKLRDCASCTRSFLSEGHVASLDVGLIARALQCRQTAADPDALFPARTVLPSQIDACASLFDSPDGLSR
jgi:hypothetical protein